MVIPDALLAAILSIFLFLTLCAALALIVVTMRRPAGVPLIVVTADRPAELLGIGANQTTVQAGIFGSAVRRSWDESAPSADDPVQSGAARSVSPTPARGRRPG